MAKKQSEQQVQEEVVKTKQTPKGVVKMIHPYGKVAYVHPSMIPAYKSGGFKEDE